FSYLHSFNAPHPALHSFTTRRSSDLGGIWLDSIGNDSATLTLDGIVVANNQAFSVIGIGGGLGNDGTGAITVSNSTVRNNMATTDRKSTRLNSSHVAISYAVFCLKKK